MMGIFSTLLFTRKLIVKDKFAVRAFSIDPGGSRTHRHGDFYVPTRPLSYRSYIQGACRYASEHSFII